MKSRITVVVVSLVASTAHLQATIVSIPDGFSFGTTGIQGVPLSQGGTVPDMVVSSDNSAIWFESKTNGVNTLSYTGGINMVGTPLRFFLGALTPTSSTGHFQIFNFNDQYSSSPTPLFEVDSTNSKAVFNGVNVEVNSGTLKVGGLPVLTSAASSVAFGPLSTSSGTNSFASGNSATATGTDATAFGQSTTAQGYNQFVVGQWNIIQGTSTANYNSSDQLFIVGNGSGPTSRFNAFSVDRAGNAHLANSFAAGYDSTATGNRSISSGRSDATGDLSTALGNAAALGSCSSAFGNSGSYANYSTSMGNSAAGGQFSTAMGNSTSNGKYSTSAGVGTEARAYASTAVGSYNLNGNPSLTTWQAADDAFVVGNGVDASHRSNAMVLKKNGSMAVGMGAALGGVAASATQTVVGAYNDISTDSSTANATDHSSSIFTVGMGTSDTDRKNALRVTIGGKLLVQPAGELSMGSFTSGERP